MEHYRWDLMTVDDLPEIEQVMLDTYPHLPEETAAFLERVRLFPQGCRVLRHLDTNRVHGYIISHPWAQNDIPPLSSLLGALPTKAEVYYIHDIALLPEARGHGAAREILADISQLARSLYINRFALVALASAKEFWSSHGFREIQREPLKEKLAGYGRGAAYMQRSLD